VFDIAAVAQANQSLIGAIEDSLRIADEGRAARARAAEELDRSCGSRWPPRARGRRRSRWPARRREVHRRESP
jgi:hypothetical protein